MKLIPASFIAGFVSGMFIGIGIKTGVDVSKEGITMTILDAICKNPTTGIVSVCSNVWIYGILAFVAGLVTLIEDISANGIAYVFGLVVGFILIATSS